MKRWLSHASLLCAILLTVGMTPTSSDDAIQMAVLQEELYVFLQSWGSEMGVLYEPTGVAIGGNRVHVVGLGYAQVKVFDLHGMPLDAFGGHGSGNGQFGEPTVDYSDFRVWLTRSNGALLADIKRDGFRSCDNPPLAPPVGYDLGWRMARYDLSAFKGQVVRLVFENRNLHSGYSLGIWTYVDDVRVIDAGPTCIPTGPYLFYLPLVTGPEPACDPVVGLGAESVMRPKWP